VDNRRVDSYYAQLKVRPKHVPRFSVGLGMGGPQVGASLSPRPNPDSVSKVKAVRSKLEKSQKLSFSRPNHADRWDLGELDPEFPRPAEPQAIFREERLEMHTAFITPDSSSPFFAKGLTLWISSNRTTKKMRQGLLLLIEEFPLDDEPRRNVV